MSEQLKPQAIVRAAWALWAWTAWICVFGLYQTWFGNAGPDQQLAEQIQAILNIDPSRIRTYVSAGYLLVAASMAGLIYRIEAGKNWARVSVLVNFVIEGLWITGQSDGSVLEYLSDVPDLVLQAYALYLLYTTPGRDWFRQ